MAAFAKTVGGTGNTLTSNTPCDAHRLGPFDRLGAGEAIKASDPCYIKSDGSVWRSNGTAANAASKVHGWATIDYNVGDPVTLYHGVEIGYGPANATPGAPLYLSTNYGELETAPTTGGSTPCAFVSFTRPSEGKPHAVIYARQVL